MERLIYLDHAATSYPKPQSVLRAMEEAVQKKGGNPGRSGHVLSLRAARAVYECRENVCSLFRFNKPENVIFTQNTTYALNTAIKGVVRSGDHVVISNLEHNSVLRPLFSLSQTRGVTYSMFDATDDEDEQTIYCFKRALRDNTRVAVVTAASNVCGKIPPIRAIGALCRAKGIILIVDCAQAGGVIPLDASVLNADFLCFAGHKGLYGPQGTGILLCCGDKIPEPLAEGGNGVQSESRGMGEMLPERLEAGTVNTPGICGLSAGIDYVKSIGVEEIFGKSLHMTRYLTDRLMTISGVTVYGDYGVKAPVILFNMEGISSNRLSARLSDLGFCTRGGLHCAPTAHEALGSGKEGGVRVSLGYGNTKGELDRFLSALSRMREEIRREENRTV